MNGSITETIHIEQTSFVLPLVNEPTSSVDSTLPGAAQQIIDYLNEGNGSVMHGIVEGLTNLVSDTPIPTASNSALVNVSSIPIITTSDTSGIAASLPTNTSSGLAPFGLSLNLSNLVSGISIVGGVGIVGYGIYTYFSGSQPSADDIVTVINTIATPDELFPNVDTTVPPPVASTPTPSGPGAGAISIRANDYWGMLRIFAWSMSILKHVGPPTGRVIKWLVSILRS
jgi:hypothetical protein